ncbi:MAG: hypothetical protein R3E87_19805 [Burkholderiaceae bacterium]
MVIGLIIFGIATPTESAAFECAWRDDLGAGVSHAHVRDGSSLTDLDHQGGAGMVFFIILNSSIFSQLLAYSGPVRGCCNTPLPLMCRWR